ncbi:SCO family protein [Piscinibacter sp.]|jgi:protein SCO1/2|uniref:SCO family protein n=1 Tax=Piscinibacter sp. TaxID=1903157 RepID=UPI003559A7EF
MRRLFGVLVALTLAGAHPHALADSALDATEAWKASQAVLGQRPADYTLLDRNGQPVRLSAFRGKPLLVSFIYTGCFQVCPASTRSLHEAVQLLQGRFGADGFNVISIGFNQPADSPQALKAFAAQQRIDIAQWEFLSPSAASVDALARDFGFSYRATPAGFDHVLQVSVVDADGRIVRQVYGDRVATDTLGETLQQLLSGAPLAAPGPLASLIDRVRLLCTVYDPATGTYRVDYSLVLEIAGGITFALSMLVYALLEWRARRHWRRGLRA